MLLATEIAKRKRQRKIFELYPDDGPLRRELYPKHLQFFEAGKQFRERCVMAGNRTGKSFGIGGYETALHLTGLYPEWWPGRRFNKPIDAWAAGDTSETTRDIIQKILTGVGGDKEGGELGTGLIPGDKIIGEPTRRMGVAGAIDTIAVRHASGGTSIIGLKSFDQGRKKFQGTSKDLCIAEGELVQMADGSLRPIEEVVPGDMVLSITKRGEPVARKVTEVHDNGLQECIEFSTKHGPSIVLTPDHQVYAGYARKFKTRADQAEKIAQIYPGAFWPEVTEQRDAAWYVWAGLAVSEGYYAGRKITNGSIDLMEKAVSMLPSAARVRRKDYKEEHSHVPDWFLYWDEFWADVHEGKAEDKAIPSFVFKSSKEDVTLFMRWLFMGDGWANYKTVGYATTSRRLSSEVCVLLHRLGIRSSIYTKSHAGKNWRKQYWVCITRSSEVIKFLDLVGIEGKEEACASVRAEAVRREQSKRDRSKHLLKTPGGQPQWCIDQQIRARTRTSKVRSVTSAGPRRVFDLSVEGEHRFLVGNSLVSNCWLDEEPPQDVYTECITRTMTTNGMIICTFTPLEGLTDVAMMFMPELTPTVTH